jgi:hypothetical protein
LSCWHTRGGEIDDPHFLREKKSEENEIGGQQDTQRRWIFERKEKNRKKKSRTAREGATDGNVSQCRIKQKGCKQNKSECATDCSRIEM